MSNIIDFLATIGRDAKLRYASDAEMQRMLANIQVDHEVRDAVLAKDQKRLAALVGASNVSCLLVPGMVRDEHTPAIIEKHEYIEKRA